MVCIYKSVVHIKAREAVVLENIIHGRALAFENIPHEGSLESVLFSESSLSLRVRSSLRNEIRDAVEAERVLRVIPKIGQTCPEHRTFSPSFFVSFLSPEKEMKGGEGCLKKVQDHCNRRREFWVKGIRGTWGKPQRERFYNPKSFTFLCNFLLQEGVAHIKNIR